MHDKFVIYMMENSMKILRSTAKLFFTLLAVLCMLTNSTETAHADSSGKPIVVSFTLSSDSIELASPNTKVTFELTVSNPTGIASTQSLVTISNGGSYQVTTPLIRTDVPVNSSL
jgi:hypothetical protein